MKKGLVHEIALITAIVSDHYTNPVYDVLGGGYFDTLEVITDISMRIYKKFEDIIKKQDKVPDAWLKTYEKHGVDCFDDLVVKIAGHLLYENHEIDVQPR
jgi:hypothetical protein